MADNDIIKDLEEYIEHTILAFDEGKPQIEIRDILGVINRQKAEIKRLQEECNEAWRDHADVAIKYNRLFDEAETLIKKSRAEAIKEFVERLKKEKYYSGNRMGYGTWVVEVESIDNLVKKMVGERE